MSIASRFENASYGGGSITDGVRKIAINIRNFVPVENLEKGMAVTVIGHADSTSKFIYITFIYKIHI